MVTSELLATLHAVTGTFTANLPNRYQKRCFSSICIPWHLMHSTNPFKWTSCYLEVHMFPWQRLAPILNETKMHVFDNCSVTDIWHMQTRNDGKSYFYYLQIITIAPFCISMATICCRIWPQDQIFSLVLIIIHGTIEESELCLNSLKS